MARLQFSLITLITGISSICALLAVVLYALKPLDDSIAIQQLEEMGASIDWSAHESRFYGKYRTLYHADLGNTRDPERSLETVVRARHAESLVVHFEQDGDRNMSRLSRLKHIRILHIYDTVFEEPLEWLHCMPLLESLQLVNCTFPSTSLNALQRNQHLSDLTLRGSSISHDEIGMLRELKGLARLDISCCKLNGDELTLLAGNPSLMVVDVAGTTVSDNSLKGMGGRFTSLNLNYTHVSNIGVSSIFGASDGWSEMRRLHVRGTKIDDGLVSLLPKTWLGAPRRSSPGSGLELDISDTAMSWPSVQTLVHLNGVDKVVVSVDQINWGEIKELKGPRALIVVRCETNEQYAELGASFSELNVLKVGEFKRDRILIISDGKCR